MDPDLTYENKDYGFAFDVPENWKGKYRVIKKDEAITFVYPDYKYDDDSFQEFFRIAIMTKEEYEQITKNSPMTGESLGIKDEFVYVLYLPLDIAIKDKEKLDEYKDLLLSKDKIKERFSLY